MSDSKDFYVSEDLVTKSDICAIFLKKKGGKPQFNKCTQRAIDMQHQQAYGTIFIAFLLMQL